MNITMRILKLLNRFTLPKAFRIPVLIVFIAFLQVASYLLIQSRTSVVPEDSRGCPFVLKDTQILPGSILRILPAPKFKGAPDATYAAFNLAHNQISVSLLDSSFSITNRYKTETDAATNHIWIGDLNGDGTDEFLLLEDGISCQMRQSFHNKITLKIWDAINRPAKILDELKNNQFLSKLASDSVYNFQSNVFISPKNDINRFAVAIGFHQQSGDSHSFLKLYQPGRIIRTMAEVRTPGFPNAGFWHTKQNGNHVLTLLTANPSTIKSRNYLNKEATILFQIDENGEQLWSVRIPEAKGHITLLPPSSTRKSLLLTCRNAGKLVLYYIDPFTGKVLDTRTHAGIFHPFAGIDKEKSEWIGLLRLDSLHAQLLNTNGSLGEKLAIPLPEDESPILLVNHLEKEPVFAVSSGKQKTYFWSVSGELISFFDKNLLTDPAFLPNPNTLQNTLFYHDNNGRLHTATLAPNPSSFWWVWRYRWILTVLIFPPLLVTIFAVGIEYLRLKLRARTALTSAYEEIETLVTSQAAELETIHGNHKKATEAMQASFDVCDAERLRLLDVLDHISDVLLCMNESYQITDFNAPCARMFSLAEHPHEKHCDMYLHNLLGDQSTVVENSVARTFETGSPARNIRVTTSGSQAKELMIHTHLLTPADTTTKLALLTIQDVTDLATLADPSELRTGFYRIRGNSPKMQEIYSLLENLSNSLVTMLIFGESGTGKELLAEAIHSSSSRSGGPFIRVNCAALSETLLESELFGHVKGAFTGAISDRIGRFEAAEGGTIFLDEIGEISLIMQAKLLRVLESGEYDRVGETSTRHSNARIIAATNQNLQELIQKGSFRLDLYHRLSVFTIHVPPLRERLEDLSLVAHHILNDFAKAQNRTAPAISAEVMDLFRTFSWPGNIRELRNYLEASLVMCQGDTIHPYHLPTDFHRAYAAMQGVEMKPTKLAKGNSKPKERQLSRGLAVTEEKRRIVAAVNETSWNISRAAEILGVSRNTLYRKMKELHIERPA